jgi:hypothetical protein
MKTLLDQLTELALEVNQADPIDFGYLPHSEEDTFRYIAANVLDMYLGGDKDAREMTMLATVTKLVVENFVLNLRLHDKNRLQ